MNLSLTTIKKLHDTTIVPQNTVSRLISNLSDKLGENENQLNVDVLKNEIDRALIKLQNNQNKKTEYLENAFSLLDAIRPFNPDAIIEELLHHIKSLLKPSYFVDNQINFKIDISNEVTSLVKQNLGKGELKQKLHKIHIDNNNFFKASIEQIKSLKTKMVKTLSQLKNDNQTPIKLDIVFAITDKNIGIIPACDQIWSKNTRNNSIRRAEVIILNEVFPDVDSLEEYTNLMELYTNSPKDMPYESYKKGLNIFIISDGAHPYLDWVKILCERLRLDHTKIVLDERTQHFYIAHKPPSFIPNDNNCAFHCIQYLLEARF